MINCKGKIVIISNISTSLITVNKLSKNIMKLSLMDVLGIKDSNLKDVFKKLDVKIPKDYKEVENIIKKFFDDSYLTP